MIMLTSERVTYNKWFQTPEYLQNENILEYAQILVTGGILMFLDIERHPIN